MSAGTQHWRGWGRRDRVRRLGDRELTWLAGVLGGAPLPETPAPALGAVTLPESRLPARAARALADRLGPDGVGRSHEDRALHALGQSYHDLLHCRSGQLASAPDLVARPKTEADVGTVLRWAAEHDVALVPFGGGSSVVGGVSAHGSKRTPRVVSLDLRRLDRLLAVEPMDRLACAEAGIEGPRLEAALARRGYTLGHYPQSFEHSTLGGWIASRGAGQQSGRYGSADRWFVAARLVTPTGIWDTERGPASAAGPRIGDLVVGSEGVLGIVTRATVLIRPRPEQRWERAWLFRDFATGLSAVRALSQAELEPAMLRLSDADETRFQSAFAGLDRRPSWLERGLRRWLAARGYGERPCLLLAGIEGEAARVNRDARRLSRLTAGCGGQPLGAGPARAWRATRFEAPYLRDPLLDRGLGVDTLETATRWSGLARLYAATRAALKRALEGTHGVVLAHVSHSYPDGASLYFTFLFRRDPTDPIGQWWRIKRAATEAILAHGGTLSHHHGVGEDHRPWLAAEKGAPALALLRAAKAALDPEGRLNPGKLVPPA